MFFLSLYINNPVIMKSIAESQKLTRGSFTNKLIYTIIENHYKAYALPF